MHYNFFYVLSGSSVMNNTITLFANVGTNCPESRRPFHLPAGPELDRILIYEGV